MAEMQGVERREFLKGAMLLGASVTAGALVGCSPQSGGSEGSESANGETLATTQPVAADETRQTDVVVVGSGIAGLSAAIEAAEAGAQVTVLEKLPKIGGNSSVADGITTPASDEIANEIITDEINYAHYMVNTKMVEQWVQNAQANAEWLTQLGVGLISVEIPGMAGVFSFYEGMGEAMIAAVEKKAQAVGVEILVETPATEILTDGGKVIGVRAEDAGAKLIDFQAQAVILATAGFAEDEELFQSVNNWTADKYTYKGLPGHTGDGLKMAVAAGMTMARSVTPMMIGLGVRSLGLGSVLSAAGTMEPTNVWVNQDGVRFAFEDGNVHNYAIKTQHEAFSLLDSAALDRFESAGLIYGLAAYVPRGVPAPDIRSELNKELGSGNPDIFSADSIEELARAIGVDPAQLTKTIDTYNGYCDIGADPEYGKAPDFLARIEQGPFYAFRPTVNFLVTMGGIQVNSQMQVVNEEYQPIEGLYAAGMECGGFFGEVYPAEVGGGSGQAIALATGRISGRNAAEFAK